MAASVAKLDDGKRQVLFSLHNAFEDEETRELGIFRTNALPLGSGSSTGGIFVESSRINHSCIHNAQNTWNENLGKLTIHAMRDIDEGEEITIIYLSERRNRADRQRTLQRKFRFTCSCQLCCLPPDEQRASDSRLDEIQRLDESIVNLELMLFCPLQQLNKVRRLLKLCKEEGIDDASVPRAYYDAFQIAIANSDIARAKVFAERVAATRMIIEGEDSPTVHKNKKLATDPTGYSSYGSSSQWSTSTTDIPSDLSAEDFELWLWREQKEKAPGWRQYADLRDDAMFPSFRALPDENEVDPEFYDSEDGFTYRPRKHWCFLGEIVDVDEFLRLKLIVEDRGGKKIPVLFYTDTRGSEINPSRVREGFTVVVLYAEKHGFLDMTRGIRHEQPKMLVVSSFPPSAETHRCTSC